MPKEVETGSDKTAIRPFHVNVAEEELTDLRRRINATRWPDRETVADATRNSWRRAATGVRSSRT